MCNTQHNSPLSYLVHRADDNYSKAEDSLRHIRRRDKQEIRRHGLLYRRQNMTYRTLTVALRLSGELWCKRVVFSWPSQQQQQLQEVLHCLQAMLAYFKLVSVLIAYVRWTARLVGKPITDRELGCHPVYCRHLT